MKLFKYISLFVLLVLLQALIFNNVFFLGYMNPYVYVIFLLYLPVSIPRSYILLIAFALGLSIDIFENSGGIHASASLTLALFRLGILRSVSQRLGDDFENLRVKDLGLVGMILYSSLSIFIHHFVLFLLESFRFSDIGIIFIRTLYSSAFTLIFVLLIQLWNYRRRQ